MNNYLPVSDASFNKTPLPISNSLLEQLSHLLNKHPEVINDNHITINFRDKRYSVERGGYHPVEIALSKDAKNHYSITYITDFSFNGYPYPELERDIDFDLSNGAVFTRYSGWKGIASPSMSNLYKLWESNFIAYLDIKAYDQIELRSH